MAKVKNPVTFAEYYKIDPKILENLNIFNPTLAVDTKLFIDPLLLEHSSHTEINTEAVQIYREHFTRIIKLLSASNAYEDVAWRNARRLFQFHEVSGTCLGYGAASISGSGFGKQLIAHVMKTAKEIVDLGIVDPDLFVALALFENDIGPDRISDMTTNVILDALIKLNNRIIKKLGIQTTKYNILGKTCNLASNPFQSKNTPVILIPTDILRDLPIATDWDDVQYAAAKNEYIRNKVNQHIAQIWATKTKRDKKELKKQVLNSEEAFKTLLDAIHQLKGSAYNVKDDPLGLIKWAEFAKVFTSKYPMEIKKPPVSNIDNWLQIVHKIVEQFRILIEDRGLWKSLWHGNKPLIEKYSQRLFFAVAYSYCKANNLDISPEVDTGTGQVDFKLSKGFKHRILVELKLSLNKKLLSGYQKQLEAYKKSEETMRAIYLVIDVGSMGKKDEKLLQMRTDSMNKNEPASDIEFIDGKRRKSASNL